MTESWLSANAPRGVIAPLAVAVLSVALPCSAIAGVLTGQWLGRAGECQLVLEEYDREVLHLRMRREGAPMDPCMPEAAALAAALDGLLRSARADRAGPFSLFLGRVVEFPWLSRELAQQARESRGWDPLTGRPLAGDPNRFVAGLLAGSAALRDLVSGYAILHVSVEKVLVPTRAEIRSRQAGEPVPDQRLPYDALLWVRLESKR
jgi:hypothetical protein